MTSVLPQQHLLLELLTMSGDLAANMSDTDSLLWKTLQECEGRGWVMLKEVAPKYYRVTITGSGRMALAET